MNQIEEIESLAFELSTTDYGEAASVGAHNATAVRVRELVSAVRSEPELLALLEKQHARSWVAFQLLEQPHQLASRLYLAACDVLREIESAGETAGMAARRRLNELGEGASS